MGIKADIPVKLVVEFLPTMIGKEFELVIETTEPEVPLEKVMKTVKRAANSFVQNLSPENHKIV